MLPMEAETMEMLIGGYLFVMGAAVLFVLMLMWKEKKSAFRAGYFWILAHFVVFSVAVVFCLLAIGSRPAHPSMASETNSLMLGMGGVVWAVSMLILLAAIASFTAHRHAENRMEEEMR